MQNKIPHKNKRKIFITTSGCCKRRMLDASKLTSYFKSNNCIIVKGPIKADYIILVTCAYKQSEEDNCFKLINKLKAYKGDLIVVGCLPEISPSRFKEEFEGVFFSTKNLDEIGNFFKGFKIKFSDLPDAHRHSPFFHWRSSVEDFLFQFELTKNFCIRCLDALKHSIRGSLGQYLRVCFGCVGNCTYCAVRNAIGRLKSKPLDSCLKEYKNLLNEGYKSFIVCGDDVGSYGLDIKSSFSELLEKLSTVDSDLDIKWDIPEVHPHWVIRYKSELIKRIEERKLVKLGCPVQSGSNRILKLMNRFDDTKKVTETLLEFKKINPRLYLSTHMLLGFPSEREEDVNDTLNLIVKSKFNFVYIYTYTDREGIAASKIENKIDEGITKERLKIATKILDEENIRWCSQ